CDTGEPIPLSMFYNGSVYATIPAVNQARAIEAFVPEEIEFTDYDASQYEFHAMQTLSKYGVIKGNDQGEAKPFDNVTRAEAAAMVMRFIGLADMPQASETDRFEDVLQNDWFYSVVMSAYECGIIKGDSETTFSPKRDVTREEITVMVVRALQYADLRCPERDYMNAIDKDKISPWAVEAYDYIGANYASDYDDTDPVNPVRVLNPQKAATRYDVAYILNNTQRVCQLYASDMAIAYGFDKEMPIIDGSTSTYPFTEAVYTQLFANGPGHKQFPTTHSKSHVSYQRLINGEVDMLFASVYPASDILALAKEKGVELELIPIAYDAMIFFTNADNPSEGLTKAQISDIYVNDAYDNWSEVGGVDAKLYPYCRNNDSGSHAQMEKHFLNGNDIHPEVQKETSMTMSNVLTDVMGAQTDDPVGYGLGYSIYYYYHNMDPFYNTSTELKLLAIDGVHPTDETIADGSYPLSNNTYIVLRKDTPEDAPARKMAEFMLTEAGQACVELAGFGKLK
ncbi:MAG: substrate-binding domain-containing protein, partial [Clostridia bacterium]|nr:substrate-binding domain-containing protein [Clostridia bacterium]